MKYKNNWQRYNNYKNQMKRKKREEERSIPVQFQNVVLVQPQSQSAAVLIKMHFCNQKKLQIVEGEDLM